MFRRFRIAVVFLALFFAHAVAPAQEKTKIFLGASSNTLGYSPLWVATKKGFFDQQGLDVQLVLLRGVPMTLQALAANSLQIGSGGPEPYIEASERGLSRNRAASLLLTFTIEASRQPDGPLNSIKYVIDT